MIRDVINPCIVIKRTCRWSWANVDVW